MRMRRVGLLAAFGTLAIANSASADSIVYVSPDRDPVSNDYVAVISKDSWSGAEAYAKILSGNLVSVADASDNAWIVDHLLTDHTASGGPNLSAVPVWIGLYDPVTGDGTGMTHASDFKWVDGSSSAYRNWYGGEPSNSGDDEYFTTINWHYAEGHSDALGAWNDTPDAGTTIGPVGPYYGLAEFATLPPTPSAAPLPITVLGGLSLFGIVLIGAWRRHRGQNIA